MRCAGDLLDRVLGEPDQLVVEEDRLDLPDPLPLDPDVLLVGDPLRNSLRSLEHRSERLGVQVPLVEQALGRLDDRGDDAGLRDDAAHRAHGSASHTGRDLTDLELEPRSAGERVAAGVHRRRPCMSGLTAEGDLVALDPEGAEDDTERQVERLEHRPLLDVQLDVGGRVLELLPRLERAPSSSAQLTSRTVVFGSPSSARRRITSTPAMTFSAPSSQPPFGTESMCPPMSTACSERPASVHHWLPASSTSSSSGTFSASHSFARTQVSVHATR